MAEQRCLSTCFSLYIVLSLFTHVAELALNGLLAYTLYQDVDHRNVFFALTSGVLIIPLVTTQLLSAIFLLRRRGDTMSCGEAVFMALLHVLQLGFIWRHISILREKDALVKKNDLSELFVLRLTFTFAAAFPLMLVQMYLILTGVEVLWRWVLFAALTASVLSAVWSVASFRRSHETNGPDAVVLSWPGSLFRLLWRTGEIVSRVISLTLFASLYHEWLFLVLGFHWVVMLICLSLPQTLSDQWCGSTLAQRMVFCVVTSYSYVFCYINFSTLKSAAWYTLYYVIMFLENGTLSIVWLTKSEKSDFSSRYLLVFISALAFFAAMVCLAVYFKFFHIASAAGEDQDKEGVCVAKAGPSGCINCRLSLCTKHQNTRQQRPFNSGWMTQYHSAVSHGQYYKHAMHDSLLDSMSDLASMTTAGSTNRRLQQKLSALDKELSDSEGRGFHRSAGRLRCTCGQDGAIDSAVSSCQIAACATCQHRRLIKNSRSDLTDTTSVLTFEGGASQNLGYDGSDESQANIPAWLPSGESYIARHLLTDAPETEGAISEKERQLRQEKNLEHYRSLLKQEAQRWASDGYSTDHTVLEWSKLPVTVLGKNVWGIQDPESECCAYCYAEMSPGDSEVSSIFRAAQRAQLEGCPGCIHGNTVHGTSSGGDVVYGVPMVHLRHKEHHKTAPSVTDSDITCLCCLQQHEQILKAHQLHLQQEKQQKVFTISGKDGSALSMHDPQEHVKSDVSSKKSKTGASRKSKNSERRKSKEREKAAKEKDVDESIEKAKGIALETVVLSDEEGCKSDANSQSSKVNPPVPSKLQVKAIAEKCDSSASPKPKEPSQSSEPIYENVKASTSKHSSITEPRTTDHTSKSAATSEKAGDPEDEPVSPRTVHVHHVALTDIQPALKATRSREKRRRSDPWYVCSESEDSALPPETFSSSNDSHCFTGSDNDSDGSLELII